MTDLAVVRIEDDIQGNARYIPLSKVYEIKLGGEDKPDEIVTNYDMDSLHHVTCYDGIFALTVMGD